MVFFYVVSKRPTAGKGFSATRNGSWPFRLVGNALSPSQFFFLFSSDDMSLSCPRVVTFRQFLRTVLSALRCLSLLHPLPSF